VAEAEVAKAEEVEEVAAEEVAVAVEEVAAEEVAVAAPRSC